MKRLLLIIFCILFSASAYPAENDYDRLFDDANRLYRDGQFEQALNGYLQIEKSGRVSGHLYYNMGNACFRLKMLGHAVLYYERALLLMPGDDDLEYNLSYVRKLTKDEIEESPDILSSIFFWLSFLTLDGIKWIYLTINILFWSMLLIRLFVRKEWTFNMLILMIVLWAVSGLSFARKYYECASDNRAVVLQEKINVLSGPDPDDTVLFVLHAGTTVYYERSEDKWKLISLPDRKRGWVEDNAVELIRKQGK